MAVVTGKTRALHKTMVHHQVLDKSGGGMANIARPGDFYVSRRHTLRCGIVVAGITSSGQLFEKPGGVTLFAIQQVVIPRQGKPCGQMIKLFDGVELRFHKFFQNDISLSTECRATTQYTPHQPL